MQLHTTPRPYKISELEKNNGTVNNNSSVNYTQHNFYINQ